MRWTRGYRSRNVEDRRFQTGRGKVIGGAGLGLGGLALVLLLSLLTGQDFFSLLGGDGGVMQVPSGGGPSTPGATTPEEEELKEFVSFVLDDIQGAWGSLLPELGREYEETQLVLFRDAIQSACKK